MPKATDESQTHKPRNWPLIIVCVITALAIVIALGAKSGISYLKALRRNKLPYYSLEVRGDKLVFRTVQNGKPETLKTVSTYPKNALSLTESGSQLTVLSGSKTVANVNRWDALVLSPKNQAVFYNQVILVPPSKPGQPNSSKYTLNMWDEKGGTARLIPPLGHIMSPKLSMDERTFIASYYDEKVQPPFGTFVYDFSTRKGVLTGPPTYPDGVAAVIDSDNVIVPVPTAGVDSEYRIMFRSYKISTRSYGPFYVDDTVKEVVGFNGSIWCRAESPGKQSIFRLNKTFDKVEERFDFPAINPEP